MDVSRYQRAERFMGPNRPRYVANLDVAHHWLPGADVFWYRQDGTDGTCRFVRVDAATGAAAPAFDHDRAADLLAEALGRAVQPDRLPFASFETADLARIVATIDGARWHIDLDAGTAVAGPMPHPDELASPDGAWSAFVSDGNLWVRDVASGQSRALTEDAEDGHDYAGIAGDTANSITNRRLKEPSPPQAFWSPDSRRLLTQRIDERLVEWMHMLDVVPPDGSLRPVVHSCRFTFAGDEHGATATLAILDADGGRRVDVQLPPIPAEYLSPIFGYHCWWSADGDAIYLIARDRYSRLQTLYRIDPESGAAQVLIEERGDTFVTVHWHRRKPIARTLSDGRILWFSEKTDWGHLYLHNADGTLANPITSGDWLVHSIVHVDEAQGQVYLCGMGREAGRNPYYRHLYRVNFDGSDLRLLTPEDATHLETDVQDLLRPVDRARLPFSASGRYFVESHSRPDRPSVLVLRGSDGSLVAEVETADATLLEASGFIAPDVFETIAADGETVLYGVMYRPSDFDPGKRYPIIESSYPGPQWGRNNFAFSGAFTNCQSIAELGFIVITLDARGTRYRSKGFWDLSYGRLEDSGFFEDHIAAMRQLAARHDWIDLDRVGIYGHSGGGYVSARAMLEYPDVYHVAVSIGADHEQQQYLRWWSDLYNGPDHARLDRTATKRLAENLRGKLLLIHGDMDDNCHPAQMMRLVDALIHANKDFDMLMVPGANHMDVISPYVERRRWDYFVQHLLGETPPPYRLSVANDPWIIERR